MRIIKGTDLEGHQANIEPMVFPVFPEGGMGDPGDNGGPEQEAAAETKEEKPEKPEVDLEQARREVEQLKVEAAREAEKIREQAAAESEKFQAQLQEEAGKAREQAVKDAETVKKEGYSAGYASGEGDGYKKGYDGGFTKGKAAALEETQATVNIMKEVVEQLKAYHKQILNDSQADIAKMAISVARKVLQKEIMVDPMTVVTVVRNALAKVSFKKQFLVHVNPLDLEVIQSAETQVAEMLDNYEILEFKASPQVEAGGCVIQTESGTVDAQIDRQVDEVEQAVMKAMGGEE